MHFWRNISLVFFCCLAFGMIGCGVKGNCIPGVKGCECLADNKCDTGLYCIKGMQVCAQDPAKNGQSEKSIHNFESDSIAEFNVPEEEGPTPEEKTTTPSESEEEKTPVKDAGTKEAVFPDMGFREEPKNSPDAGVEQSLPERIREVTSERTQEVTPERTGKPDKPPVPVKERVIWQELKYARYQGKKLVLTLGGEKGFKGSGLGSKAINKAKRGSVSYTLSNGRNHHYLGLSFGGKYYAYKVEGNVIIPHINMSPDKSFRSAFRTGDTLTFTIDAQGRLINSLNGKALAYRFALTVQNELLRPEFRFSPYYSGGIDFNDTYIKNGVSLTIPQVCQPSTTRACKCTNQQSGKQYCASDGRAWGSCSCGSQTTYQPMTTHFSVAEYQVYKKRANKQDTHNYHTNGDTGKNSIGDWSHIKKYADAFIKKADVGGASGPRYYIWKGPQAGTKFFDPTKGSWNGKGAVPCLDSAKDPLGHSDPLLFAGFYALIKDSAAHRTKIKPILLQQVREKLVNFADKSRWATGRDQHGCYRHQTNPFFFAAEWAKKILYVYEYTKIRYVNGKVVDSGLYSAKEKQEIETWLRNAGDYFRRLQDEFYVKRYFNGSLSDRIHGKASSGIYSKPYKYSRLYDGGPFATEGQLQYNNRTLSTMNAVASIGWFLHDSKMKQSAKLYFQEFIKYSVTADGTPGDWERSGETGTAYVAVVLGALIEMADVFARHSDASLYEYQTSEGASCKVSSGVCTTKGGPKGLLMMIKNFSKYFRSPADGGWSPIRKGNGHPRDGYAKSAAEVGKYKWLLNRYCQHYLMFTQANVYYRDKGLAQFIYNETSAGYRGWQPLSKLWGNGYANPPTRATMGTSVGKLFLYGKMELRSKNIWPFPKVKAKPFY